MRHGQFLVRNRHQLNWYGRVIIPHDLRHHFAGKRELRVSLKTPDKQRAKRLSRQFWVHCQTGFDRLQTRPVSDTPFTQTGAFLDWAGISPHNTKNNAMAKYIETTDALGNRHIIDLNDPEKEMELAQAFQANALAILELYKFHPEILQKLMQTGKAEFTTPDQTPETETSFSEAIDEYIEKLEHQGRKGRKLSPRTLITYTDKLRFWQAHFAARAVHSITLKELAEIQRWLIFLPSNFAKKGITVDAAIKGAKEKSNRFTPISPKTREEYLGQLKGFLEFAHSSGYIKDNIASHVEMPNTKQAHTITRLPFTESDLYRIFPPDYGSDFGTRITKDDYNNRFWFPLLAAFTGARLEELGQLQTEDIHTCPDTGIIYLMIENKGATADGIKKRIKNLNSIRPIPIHPTLLSIGFIDYVEYRKNEKRDTGLFKLKRDKQGRFAKPISNWFSRLETRKNGQTVRGYIERQKVNSKGTTKAGDKWSKSFHSFRHTVIDNLRGKQLQSGEFIRELDIALVVGHERDKRETASYGIDRSQLPLRKAVIEALHYEDVEFEEIRWRD